ncbi:MAG: hypothetical protein RL348_139 [Bacteroidota bacterium]|jgi:RNA polymerase sigma-70 factor (ECF subfamily)
MNNTKPIETKQALDLWLSTKDERYFKHIYNNIHKGLYRHIFRIIKDEDISQDILSETFLLIIQNIHQYDPSRGAFSTWTYNIAQNAAYSWLQQEKKQDTLRQHSSEVIYNVSQKTAITKQEDEDSNQEYIETPNKQHIEYEVIFGKLHQRAVYEIRKLSDVYRECMFDREIRGLSYNEIAIKHNLLINTVKSKIRLGREIVKFQLIQYAESIGISSESLNAIFPSFEHDAEE